MLKLKLNCLIINLSCLSHHPFNPLLLVMRRDEVLSGRQNVGARSRAMADVCTVLCCALKLVEVEVKDSSLISQ